MERLIPFEHAPLSQSLPVVVCRDFFVRRGRCIRRALSSATVRSGSWVTQYVWQTGAVSLQQRRIAA